MSLRPETVVVVGNLASSLLRFRGRMMAEFVAGGCRVLGCAPEIEERTKAGLEALGVEPVNIPLSRSRVGIVSDFRLVFFLWRLFRSTGAGIVLTYTIKPIVYGNLAASMARVDRIVSIVAGLGSAFGGSTSGTITGRIMTAMFSSGLRRCTLVVFQNPDDRQTVEAAGILRPAQRRVVVSGSGVDLAEYSPAGVPETPVFLLAARLIEEKGIRVYHDAARVLKRRHPLARFLLAGWFDPANPDGIDRGTIDRWVAEGDLEYLGVVDDLRPVLAGCTAFVLPSRYREGVPRTSLEAMSMGKALITTDAPGCRETVDQGRNGFLVPVDDVQAVVDAMEALIKDRDAAARMGRASRDYAERRFDVRIVNADILDAVLGEGPGRRSNR